LPLVAVADFDKKFNYSTNNTHGNPLRGFVPFGGGDWDPCKKFPCSMENTYVAFKKLMTGWETFDLSPLEKVFRTVAARGRQSIIRVYVDYPNKDSKSIESILPSFLIPGMKVLDNKDGTGVHPDYDNANLIKALVQFIKACGAKYDGDKRIAVWQVGLLGHWGEWHNWPTTDFSNQSNQKLIIDAYTSSFKRTVLQNRYPNKMGGYMPSDVRMGYIDDSVMEDTFGSADWYFHNQLKSVKGENIYLTQMMGGELYPPHQSCAFSGGKCGKQDFGECVQKLKFSYLWNNYAFEKGYPSYQKDKALAAASQMGYQIHLDSVKVSNSSVRLTVVNQGLAPFYYPISVRVKTSGTTKLVTINTAPGKKNVYDINMSGAVQGSVVLSLYSAHTVGPIKWATKQAETSGEIKINV